MRNFTYHNPVRILFGDHALDQLPDLFREFHVSNLLLVYSGDFIKELGIWDAVRDTCVQSDIAFYEEGGVVPNPKIELVRELIALGKEKKIDFVLAVGGGSSIDTAKAVAAGIPYEHDVWDFFEYAAVPETAVPIGVITTIPASGSECSNCSIISNGLHKCGIEYDCIIPKFAIMNPEYTRTLPPYQTSAGIADILIGNEEDFQLALGIQGPEAGGKEITAKIESFKAMIASVKEAYPNAEMFATTLRQVVDANAHLWGAILLSGNEWHVAPPREISVLAAPATRRGM